MSIEDGLTDSGIYVCDYINKNISDDEDKYMIAMSALREKTSVFHAITWKIEIFLSI